MNIFYLDENPKVCAQYHCDKHVVKMILESAQMLSTAHQVASEAMPEANIKPHNIPDIMKPSYIKHPCNVWVRQSLSNYFWLASLAWELCKEYTYRYEKVHKREDTIIRFLDNWPKHIPHMDFIKPPFCMPEHCKMNDVIDSYREYYRREKNNFATWKKRSIPDWYNVQ